MNIGRERLGQQFLIFGVRDLNRPKLARVIVQDLRVTSQNLRAVSEGVKRYPAGVLVGGPPERLQLPGSAR